MPTPWHRPPLELTGFPRQPARCTILEDRAVSSAIENPFLVAHLPLLMDPLTLKSSIGSTFSLLLIRSSVSIKCETLWSTADQPSAVARPLCPFLKPSRKPSLGLPRFFAFPLRLCTIPCPLTNIFCLRTNHAQIGPLTDRKRPTVCVFGASAVSRGIFGSKPPSFLRLSIPIFALHTISSVDHRLPT